MNVTQTTLYFTLWFLILTLLLHFVGSLTWPGAAMVAALVVGLWYTAVRIPVEKDPATYPILWITSDRRRRGPWGRDRKRCKCRIEGACGGKWHGDDTV